MKIWISALCLVLLCGGLAMAEFLAWEYAPGTPSLIMRVQKSATADGPWVDISWIPSWPPLYPLKEDEVGYFRVIDEAGTPSNVLEVRREELVRHRLDTLAQMLAMLSSRIASADGAIADLIGLRDRLKKEWCALSGSSRTKDVQGEQRAIQCP
jgi:hypothetical protein